MRLCQKYDVHLLSDEIYALTTFPTKDNPRPTPFTSLMSVDKTGIVDPSLCHVIHGMSKVSVYTSVLTLGSLCKWTANFCAHISGESALTSGHSDH